MDKVFKLLQTTALTTEQIMTELESMGSESCKSIYKKHGAKEPFFGVKVQDLKKIQKQVKKNYELSLSLYNTGNSDAQYLAGLIADEKKMTKKDLQHWADKANWSMISEYTVPWIASESAYGYELGLEWIEAPNENLQAAGWSTLSSLVSIKKDAELDVKKLRELLQRVVKEIPTAANRVRYVMNGFIISVGCFVKELTEDALNAGNEIGTITVDMGGTACKIPSAPDYIKKAIDKGTIGKKKKMARC